VKRLVDGRPRDPRDAEREPAAPAGGDPTPPRLSVSKAVWDDALVRDELVFLMCLLSDARKVIARKGCFVIAGGRYGDVVIETPRQLAELQRAVEARGAARKH
jgi:hypothetical protein